MHPQMVQMIQHTVCRRRICSKKPLFHRLRVCVVQYRSHSLEHSWKMVYHWLNFQPYKSLFLQSWKLDKSKRAIASSAGMKVSEIRTQEIHTVLSAGIKILENRKSISLKKMKTQERQTWKLKSQVLRWTSLHQVEESICPLITWSQLGQLHWCAGRHFVVWHSVSGQRSSSKWKGNWVGGSNVKMVDSCNLQIHQRLLLAAILELLFYEQSFFPLAL